MKTAGLLVLVMSVSILVGAQSPEPMKGANRITIKNDRSAEGNYKYVQGVLIDNGYAIARKDDEFHTITTDPVTPKKTAVSVWFNIVAKDSLVIISGNFTSLVNFSMGGIPVHPAAHPIENRGMYGSDFKQSFAAMQNFAFKIGTATYSKF